MALELRLLGPVQACVGGQEAPLGNPRQRCVLAALAMSPGQPVGFDTIVQRVWGDYPPPEVRSVLYTYVSRLRTALARVGGDTYRALLRRAAGGYLLDIDPDRVDLHRARRLVNQARAGDGDHGHALGLLTQACELWQGTPLAGLDGGWVEGIRESLRRERLELMKDRYELELRLGRPGSVTVALSELAGSYPLDETLARLLMLSYYRSGRQAEALQVYVDFRHRLVDEIGDEPGQALRTLHEQVLRRDPALDQPDSGSPAALSQAAGGEPGFGTRPAQLPADIATFVGRQAELTQLLDGHPATDPAGPATMVVVGIEGMAGSGKTALAVHAGHRLAPHFPDGQLFLNLHGFTGAVPPVDPADALDRLLRALGCRPGEIPPDVDERAGRYRSLTAGRRLLILLDNAACEEQVLPLLPGAAGCLVLVTSRQRLTGLDSAVSLSLGPLAEDDGVDLLARVAGPDRLGDASRDDLEEIVALCGGLPLAIRVAATRLRARPAWGAGRLRDRLRDQRRRLDELATGSRSPAAAFAVSYQQLEPDQRRMFRALSLHPGPDAGPDAAAALCDVPVRRAEELLEGLVDAHLLQSPTPGRYRFHDLLRAYAGTVVAQEGEPERWEALRRVLCDYATSAWSAVAALQPGRHRLGRADPHWCSSGWCPLAPEAALAWWAAEGPNVLALAHHVAGDTELRAATVQLAHASYDLFKASGQWRDCELINLAALPVAEEAGDGAGRALCHGDLGVAYLYQGRLDEAEDHLRRSLALRSDLGDRFGTTVSLNGLCAVSRRLQRFDDAVGYGRRSVAISRELGDRQRVGGGLHTLGVVYLDMGRYEEALDCLHESADCWRELSDQRRLAACLSDLGAVYVRRGERARAMARLRESLRISTVAGNRLVTAGTLASIGEVYLTQRRHGEALDSYRRSLRILRELGNRRDLAEALCGTAAALHAAGEVDRAREHWREARRIYDDLRIPARPGRLGPDPDGALAVAGS